MRVCVSFNRDVSVEVGMSVNVIVECDIDMNAAVNVTNSAPARATCLSNIPMDV